MAYCHMFNVARFEMPFLYVTNLFHEHKLFYNRIPLTRVIEITFSTAYNHFTALLYVIACT
jgi:hypothetical protein